MNRRENVSTRASSWSLAVALGWIWGAGLADIAAQVPAVLADRGPDLSALTITRDIDYRPDADYAEGRDLLDVLMPRGATDAPVVVYFHGGLLMGGAKDEAEALAAALAPRGIGVVSANYRLSPAFMHPAHIEDAAAAVAWAVANVERYGGDPDNVHVGGFSAGAYLAALLAADDRWLGAHGVRTERIRSWIPISPFLYVEETAPDRPSSVWGEDPDVWLEASVSPYVRPGIGPMLLVVGDGDDGWRKEQNERFARALRAQGHRQVRITEVPNRRHTQLMPMVGRDDDRIADLVTGFVKARVAPAEVTGPIPVRGPRGDASRDFIFTTSGMDLAGHGYVEEEFFLEGTANRYTSPELETAEVAAGPHAYRTRVVVRRPGDASRFNGTAIVEWNNVTASQDIDIDWLYVGEHLMRNGYAWVGVSAQRVGVDHLRGWSPSRYGTLDVTATGSIENDALSYDIFAAVGEIVRAPGPVSVLPGFEVERVIATGHSQSAGRLATYLNNVHPLNPVFDGVMVHGGGGVIRTDQEVEVFKLMAETDMPRRIDTRQTDTDTFVQWEVAGTSHVDLQYAEERAKVSAVHAGRDPSTATVNFPTCDEPPYSRVPFRHVFNAAFEHLVRWVDGGPPPPSAPVLESAAEGSSDVFARDERGNVLGGIRLAAHAVPTATNSGMNSGASFCRLYGSHHPFDAETLTALYPTHADYVARVREVVRQNLEAGYILERDAEETVREAERSTIGR
jgi:acetyl esterase/lipase